MEEKLSPEDVIFDKKLAMAQCLLEIPVDSLQNAPAEKSSWYSEYLALLAIRLEKPALVEKGKAYVTELMRFYTEKIKAPERELAVLGMIQFVNPQELTIPFNQHLWHKQMIADVSAIFMNYFPSVSYADDDISLYWLSRQAQWKHTKHKIRVVFLVHSHITCDKVLPVYEAMKERDDIEPMLVIFAGADYKHPDGAYQYFHVKYPQDKIYENNSLTDLKSLRPDYVFITSPYEGRRPFPSYRVNDIVQFAKVCTVMYGSNLVYNVTNRLFDDYPHFWRNIYFPFVSAPTAKTMLEEKFPALHDYQHVNFLGYPVLEAYYNMESEPSPAKRILWTPRWTPKPKNAESIGGSNFMEYKDNFVSLRERYGDKVEIFFRPHMNLFRQLIAQKIMSRDETVAYKRTLKKNNIIRHSTLADMDKSIRNVDIFLADYSSALICFFLTGRPIIYCEFPNAKPFPEYQEMFSAMYIAHSWDEVEHYLDDLIAGNDPLFEKRQVVAKQIYELHKDATEKIIGHLVQDFNQSLAE